MLDATGIGDPIFDDLVNHIRVTPYKFNNKSKQELIINLALAIEQQKISFPPHTELISELEVFGYDITPNGNVRYNAPEGFHDDIVIALALATWMLKHQIVLTQRGSEAGNLIYG